jgi:hypothetical protein
MASWEWTAAAILLIGSVIYTFRGWIISLLTPKGVRGIPAYPDSLPVMGDLPRLGAVIKEHNSFSVFFDQIGKDLGPIAQVRLSFLKTYVRGSSSSYMDPLGDGTSRGVSADKAVWLW